MTCPGSLTGSAPETQFPSVLEQQAAWTPAQASFLPCRLFRRQPDAPWLRASWALLHTGGRLPKGPVSLPEVGALPPSCFRQEPSARCGTCSQEAELLLPHPWQDPCLSGTWALRAVTLGLACSGLGGTQK